MMGVPVIAANYPGIRALVEGEEIGLCVNPDEPAAIAAAVNRMAADPEGRSRMKANGLRATRNGTTGQRVPPPAGAVRVAPRDRERRRALPPPLLRPRHRGDGFEARGHLVGARLRPRPLNRQGEFGHVQGEGRREPTRPAFGDGRGQLGDATAPVVRKRAFAPARPTAG